jgi:hypothetical protein
MQLDEPVQDTSLRLLSSAAEAFGDATRVHCRVLRSHRSSRVPPEDGLVPE